MKFVDFRKNRFIYQMYISVLADSMLSELQLADEVWIATGMSLVNSWIISFSAICEAEIKSFLSKSLLAS